MIRNLTLISLLLLFIQINIRGQFKSLSGIHDPENVSLMNLLQKAGFEKVAYYYDKQNHKDGEWKIYPTIQISKNIMAVNVSKIPGQTSKYNYIVLVDMISMSIADTLGPYYDTFVDALSVKFRHKQMIRLKVRLSNPSEPADPKYTIIEYSRDNSKFKEIRSYNKK